MTRPQTPPVLIVALFSAIGFILLMARFAEVAR